ncbi:MAG TPA: CBS domain-containing protein [Pilimelia sp.]|nr:CBS domain-containing protein [Pilimelia sp.]
MATTQLVREVMTEDVVYLPAETPLEAAAREMREKNIGDVVVTEGSALAGVLTDRDIVVRAVADGQDPRQTPIGQIASRDLVTVDQDAPASHAVELMRTHAVRRVLVCDADRQLVGIVSIGDLAMEMDPSSALSDISEASPNR